MEERDEKYAYVQSFLIVDERILNSIHIVGINWTNVIISSSLLISFLLILPIANEFRGLWSVFTLGIAIFTLFYAIQSRSEVIYFVTKFRIIELEINPLMERISRSPLRGSFRDIHYSQIESIYHGVPRYNPNRLWLGLFMIATAWAIYTGQDTILSGDSPLLPLVILLTILGMVNIFISLPIRSKRLEVQSQSGTSFSIPSGFIDTKFIDDLIDASRTFQTYGAI